MTFIPEKTDEFIVFFKDSQQKIKSFEGCHHVELMHDVNETNVYCTYSIWESEEYLNKYRFSAFFKIVWSKTKPLFSDKAVAYSLEKVPFNE
jgi:heme-degrading monooxygenase HmoA